MTQTEVDNFTGPVNFDPKSEYDERLQLVLDTAVNGVKNIYIPHDLDPRDVEPFLETANAYQKKLAFQYLAMDSKWAFFKFLREQAPETTDFEEVERSRLQFEERRLEYEQRLTVIEHQREDAINCGKDLVQRLASVEREALENARLNEEFRGLEEEVSKLQKEASLEIVDDDTLFDIMGQVNDIPEGADLSAMAKSAEDLKRLTEKRESQIRELQGTINTSKEQILTVKTNLDSKQDLVNKLELEQQQLKKELEEKLQNREKMISNATPDNADEDDDTNRQRKARKLETTAEWYNTMYNFWTRISGVEDVIAEKDAQGMLRVEVKYAKYPDHPIIYFLNKAYKIQKVEGYSGASLSKWVASSQSHSGLDGLSYVSRRIMYEDDDDDLRMRDE
ncbi:unnamed protein product [Kuraishia capsulata CBS 1993]|uniref:Uncharacterized protein n=1 Tax=Kuraishia capsulata CBS 1993 TaxID=1382522 RepID=W6MK34_9ASCO|nr:uncharacterized protein KUCA_T00002879001 [Kuraishia capsulata CBS 1993]CDK26904.1 unnamed protein product [Kuraishia capsulata CBS 1993]